MQQALVDCAFWALALPMATVLRYDFRFDPLNRGGLLTVVTLAAIAQVAIGYLLYLYRRRLRYASFDEIVHLSATVLTVGLLLTLAVWIPHDGTVPRSVPVLATGFALSGMAGVRVLRRMHLSQRRTPHGAEPIIVVGAGDAATRIVETLLDSSDSPYRPVALLDDNPFKADLRISGVKVEGTIDDLVAVVRRHGATSVLLAIPTGGPDLIRRVNHLLADIGIRLLVLPTVTDMFGSPAVSDIRPVTEADLLGRATADIDPDAVAHYITGKRVLVTGAGGSIGSELCRQIARFEPAQLFMLDRDESGLHEVQLSIEGRALLDTPNLVLADIRDPERLDEVFQRLRPEVVFHAAALKHLTLLEWAPEEAWKTNVFGTQHVLAAAARAGVERVVNISTDKAADPTSVLGLSKRVAERLTAHHACTEVGTYVSVRFGNVLGSRGSVVHIFRAQAESGGPITVTHPDVTRYFMTVEEAVRLTIYAGAIGRSGEVLVLDMGVPVRIASVAERFAQQHDPPLEIVFTGLRPGEKLHEDLIATGEADHRPIHPLITHVPVAPICVNEVVQAAQGDRCTDALRRAAFAGLTHDTEDSSVYAAGAVQVIDRPPARTTTRQGQLFYDHNDMAFIHYHPETAALLVD